MKVTLTESQFDKIFGGDDETTFYEFMTKAKNFIRGLLDNPMDEGDDEFFKGFGYDRKKLINKLGSDGIVVKKENVTEKPNEDGKKVAYYQVSYSVPKKDFEKKIKAFYDKAIEGKKGKIDECDCGGCMGGGDFLGGATNTESSGQYTTPVFGGPMRRDVYKPKAKAKKRRK